MNVLTHQTVNLLALRLQWFESTPTQASPRAVGPRSVAASPFSQMCIPQSDFSIHGIEPWDHALRAGGLELLEIP